jgi:hypothetical protein
MHWPSTSQTAVVQPVALAEQQPLWHIESMPTAAWQVAVLEQAKFVLQLLVACTQQPDRQA